MKAIRACGDIVSLENILRVQRIIDGSGCKSNPYRYYIRINYLDNKYEHLDFDTEEEMDECMDEIFDILTE